MPVFLDLTSVSFELLLPIVLHAVGADRCLAAYVANMDGISTLVFERAERLNMRKALVRHHVVTEALKLSIVTQLLQTVDDKVGRHPRWSSSPQPACRPSEL